MARSPKRAAGVAVAVATLERGEPDGAAESRARRIDEHFEVNRRARASTGYRATKSDVGRARHSPNYTRCPIGVDVGDRFTDVEARTEHGDRTVS